mmetsp:Transcript_21924/g.85919  ORF Transcript_21924/g.85919 Transcript_21924/m.85919 type:complete len:307 (+) Transcript_21924:804-1724(+)
MVDDLQVLEVDEAVERALAVVLAEPALLRGLGDEQHVAEEVQLPLVLLLVLHNRNRGIPKEPPRRRKNGGAAVDAVLNVDDLLLVLAHALSLVDVLDNATHFAHCVLEGLMVRVRRLRLLQELPQQQRILAEALHRLDQEVRQIHLPALGRHSLALNYAAELRILLHEIPEPLVGSLLVNAVHCVQLEVGSEIVEEVADDDVHAALLGYARAEVGVELLVDVVYHFNVAEHLLYVCRRDASVLTNGLQEQLDDDLQVADVVLLGVDDLIQDLLPGSELREVDVLHRRHAGAELCRHWNLDVLSHWL